MTRKPNAQGGGLYPMKDRLSAAEIARRQAKHEWRQSVAIEHGKTRAIAVAAFNVTSRGFFGRLKWALFGK